jgi:hypothetical protein
MAITAYTSKYHDDINTPDSSGLTPLDKNYLRILFQPGRTVQARELNQAQSLLQAQVDRLGQSLFRPNSGIIGGDCNFDSTSNFIDVTFSTGEDATSFETLIAELSDVTITSQSSGVTAIPIKTEKLNSLSYRIFIQYRRGDAGSSSGTINEIDNGIISIEGVTANVTGEVTNNGNAITATLSNGIFFVKGCVATASEQSVVRALDPDELFDGYAILKISEKQITAGADRTLFDNANGHPNFAAPGADRYQINLTLDLVENFTDEDNVVVLLQIKDNEVIIVENPLDGSNSTLENILAERTFEESGSYVVENFDIEIHEVLGSDSFLARYKNSTAANGLSQSEADKKYAATLSPSVAYVRGKRVELVGPLTLLGDKGRTTSADLREGILEDGSTVAAMGSYVEGVLRNTDNLISPASPNSDYSPESGYGVGNGEGLPYFDNYSRTYNLLDSGDLSIGTCKILSLELIDGAKHRLFLHAISLNTGKKFDDVETIQGTAVTDYGTLNFSVEQKNGVKLHDTQFNSTLFQLPYKAVKTFNSIQVTERINLSADMPLSGNDVTFQLTGVAFDKSPSSITVYNADADKVLLPTDFSVVSSADVDSLTLNIPSAEASDTISIVATAALNLDDLGIKTKTTETITLNESPLPAVGDVVELPGVYHLISVEDDNFELVTDGQTSTQYELAKVRCLKAGASTVDVVHWKFSGGNYYTVNSYRNSGGGQASLDDIPFYKENNLGDFFDIRPYPGTTDILALDPYSPITGKIDYYLPRVDSLVILPNGDFAIEKGTPSLTPSSPETSTNGLVLFDLAIPAYTFEAGDIRVRKYNHRRYTMRDIGEIDRRVSTLEYYATLSLLEKSANDKSIFDDDGTSRFKNGIVTDGFRNFTIGDDLNIDFKCHYETGRGHLYPTFDAYSIPFELTSSNNIIPGAGSEFSKSGLHNDIVTLPYNEVDYIDQPYASQFMSLVPYEYADVLGQMTLAPEADAWNDTITTPPVNVDLFGDSLVNLTNQITRLAGQEADGFAREPVRDLARTGRRFARTARRTRPRPVQTAPWKTIEAVREGRKIKLLQEQTITTTEIVNERISTALGEFVTDVQVKPYARSKAVYFRVEGLKSNSKFYFFIDDIDVTNYAHQLTRDDLINSHDHTETSILSNEISTEIGKFLSGGFELPTWFSTRWYPLKASDRNDILGSYANGLRTGKNFWRYVSTIISTVDANGFTGAERLRKIYELLPGFDQTSLTHYDGADEASLLEAFPPSTITTDINGTVEGVLVIPNNENIRLASGEKTVTITNSPRNLEDESTSSASARFISNGIQTDQTTVNISAILPRIKRKTKTTQRIRYKHADPLAQTFTVTDDTGIFATSIDLFFAEKAPATGGNANVPVRAYLVSTVNGYPSGEVIPGSEVNINYDDVRISEDGSIPTTFNFPSPIYLSPDTQYAIVAFSTCPDYKAFISEVGGDKVDLITGQIISAQPAVGTLFASSNKRTWTAFQTKDLKFKLRRASFPVNQTASFTANPQVGTHLGEIAVSSIQNNSGWNALTTTVTVEAPFTTVIDSEGNSTKVAFPGGVTATATPIFNPDDNSIDSIVITKNGFGYFEAPTITITDGTKTETISGTLNRYDIGAFNLIQKAINLGGKTTIRNEVYFGETKYDVEVGNPVEYITNQNHNIQGANVSDTRLQTFFSSTDERITPLINREIALETRDYFINETGDTSQYITKEISLDNLSDQIDMYLDISRPSSTSNIEVYAQLKDTNNLIISSTETDTDWHSLSAINPTVIPINTNRGEFSEVRFNLNTEPVEFSSFIIKIVMRGEYFSDAPFAKALRIIATA